MVEFYNLDPNYYQNIHGIEEQDFFDIKTNVDISEKQGKDGGKRKTSDMGKEAHDILKIQREVKKEEEAEKKHNIGNIE